MKLKQLLKTLNFLPSDAEIKRLREETKKIVEAIKKNIAIQGINADVFVGGSFKKGTIMRSDSYDIDIFVRFSKKYDEGKLSELLEKIVGNIGEYQRIHGSRDYFRISNKEIIFEIIPVIKISKPTEAKNVMDLSYFHVNYVKKKAKNKAILNEIVLAKRFCKANKVYGAESYISGFSGYALECLILYYKTFERMLKELTKAKGKIIIDIDKKYKNKNDIMIEMNASKTKSPIVMVDPTWKERNVLASLSNETFDKFRKAAKEFLKNPNKKFFEITKLDEYEMREDAKKSKAEFVKIILETDKQEGDIAGTKMKKFASFLEREASKYFDIKRKEFDYNGGRYGELYLIGKRKKEILRKGPPVKMRENAIAFRNSNKNVVVKRGLLYAKIKVNFSLSDFIGNFYNNYKDQVNSMDIKGLRVLR